MDNKYVNWAFVAVLALGVGCYIYFVKYDQKEPEQTEIATEISESEVFAQNFADEHGALTTWNKEFDYTIQAQDFLLSGKPVAFDAYVDDVFRREGKTYIRLTSYMVSDYVIELECDAALVQDKILSRETDEDDFLSFLDTYVVVATIDEVSKPTIALDGNATSVDDVEINVEPSTFYTARGTCVDIEYNESA